MWNGLTVGSDKLVILYLKLETVLLFTVFVLLMLTAFASKTVFIVPFFCENMRRVFVAMTPVVTLIIAPANDVVVWKNTEEHRTFCTLLYSFTVERYSTVQSTVSYNNLYLCTLDCPSRRSTYPPCCISTNCYSSTLQYRVVYCTVANFTIITHHSRYYCT
jgi:hypothetical protein